MTTPILIAAAPAADTADEALALAPACQAACDERPLCTRPLGNTLIAPRTALFHQGITCPFVYRITEGCVCVFQALPDGRRQVIDVLGPGRLIGNALTGDAPSGAETLTFTRLEALDTSGAAERGAIEAALRHMLTRSLAHATLLGRKTATERVASALIDLAAQFRRRPRNASTRRVTFTLYLTRADLADWLGLTLETVSRCLNAFKRDNVIAFDHPEVVTVKDMAALTALAGGMTAGSHKDKRSSAGGAVVAPAVATAATPAFA
ncbi:Crp/Fnr family transcriptional regulator [Rhizobium sp. SG2393]|uniref:Crp/Fnr family transcriptional regulator n=1 Tax=Rhizobium sp. SG2393 TaxID=3276279 RepID=UPI003671DFEA